jgi:predicted lactoylglutathione lyase
MEDVGEVIALSESPFSSVVASLPVADRPTSSRFYRAFLDRVPPGEPDEDGEPEPLQFDLADGVRLMLIPRGGFGWVIGEDHKVAERGTAEVIFSRQASSQSDVDALAEVAAGAGGSVVVPPGERQWGYVAVVADPDGHLWQIMASP